MLTGAIDLPNDAVLGDALEAFDPECVLQAAREGLDGIAAGTRAGWRTCRMIEALYHPRRYVRVAYALLNDPLIPRERYWPEGDVIYLHAPPREPVSRRGAILTINDRPVEVFMFPNDRRLRGLRQFTRRESAVQIWQNWIGLAGGEFLIDPDSLRRVLVRYVPEQKWIARLRARGTSRGSAATGPAKASIAVRSAAPAACRRLIHRHHWLATHARASAAPFRVPAVAGADSSGGLLAVEWIRGQSLLEALRDEDTGATMSRVAQALAALQAAPLPDIQVQSARDLFERACSAANDLALTCPELAPRLRALTAALEHGFSNVEPGGTCTLHNDFHWNQLRLDGQRVTVLDLERMCVGDTLVDVANFATQLRMLAYRPEYGVEPASAARWADEFLEHWSHRTGQAVEAERFRCYAVLSLLELARGMMRHLRPGWRSLAEACTQQAESALAEVVTP